MKKLFVFLCFSILFTGLVFAADPMDPFQRTITEEITVKDRKTKKVISRHRITRDADSPPPSVDMYMRKGQDVIVTIKRIRSPLDAIRDRQREGYSYGERPTTIMIPSVKSRD